METLKQAITTLHGQYRIPHIVVTSMSLPSSGAEPSLFVLGSTITSTSKSRIFDVKIPQLDCFFSGTGDMFASLMLVRFREAVSEEEHLLNKASWISLDEVVATELPLARAVEKVLASMHEVLTSTKEKRDHVLLKYDNMPRSDENEKKRRLVACKAAEVGIIRNRRYLENPTAKFKAEKV